MIGFVSSSFQSVTVPRQRLFPLKDILRIYYRLNGKRLRQFSILVGLTCFRICLHALPYILTHSSVFSYTYSHMFSQILTHFLYSRTHILIDSHTLSRILAYSYTLLQFLTHSHRYSHTFTHSRLLLYTFTRYHALSQILIYFLYSHTHSHRFSHIFTHSRVLLYTFTRSHALSQILTHFHASSFTNSCTDCIIRCGIAFYGLFRHC